MLTWKDMEPGCIPMLESWRCSQNAMGLDVSIVKLANYYVEEGNVKTETLRDECALVPLDNLFFPTVRIRIPV
jgi:hypothetical protein